MSKSPVYQLLIICITLTAIGCSSEPDAQEIVGKAIEQHGDDIYENSRLEFTFRDIHYTAEQRGGDFMYQRRMDSDTAGTIVDRLTNSGLTRTINGEQVQLTAEEDSAYTSSVNSVIYFAKLPYKLNDSAVNKRLLEKTTISGVPYYEIEVTFDEEGGGEDYRDRYIYWIHTQNHTMDYFAYRYHVDGGGTRFREAKNKRRVNGMLIADYNNFGSPEMTHPLEKYETYFQQDTLTKVSEINLQNLKVEQLD